MRRVVINADAEARSSTLRDERNGAECNSFYGNPDPATKEKAPISYESSCSISTRSCPQSYHQRSLSYQNHPPCVTRLSIRHGKRASPCLEPNWVRVRCAGPLTPCTPRSRRTLTKLWLKCRRHRWGGKTGRSEAGHELVGNPHVRSHSAVYRIGESASQRACRPPIWGVILAAHNSRDAATRRNQWSQTGLCHVASAMRETCCPYPILAARALPSTTRRGCAVTQGAVSTSRSGTGTSI